MCNAHGWTHLGLCLFCIPGELVVDHLCKRVAALLKPHLGHIIVRACQHLQCRAGIQQKRFALPSCKRNWNAYSNPNETDSEDMQAWRNTCTGGQVAIEQERFALLSCICNRNPHQIISEHVQRVPKGWHVCMHHMQVSCNTAQVCCTALAQLLCCYQGPANTLPAAEDGALTQFCHVGTEHTDKELQLIGSHIEALQSMASVVCNCQRQYLETRNHSVNSVIIPGMQGCLGFTQPEDGHNVQHGFSSQLVDLCGIGIGGLPQPE